MFEGEITEVQLKEMTFKADKIMSAETDSLILFKSREKRWLEKEIIGQERMSVDNFL